MFPGEREEKELDAHDDSHGEQNHYQLPSDVDERADRQWTHPRAADVGLGAAHLGTVVVDGAFGRPVRQVTEDDLELAVGRKPDALDPDFDACVSRTKVRDVLRIRESGSSSEWCRSPASPGNHVGALVEDSESQRAAALKAGERFQLMIV